MTRSSQPKLSDEALADRLIDAAEELYARHGIAGVSLRQISTAAGSANNYAVQYHFGSAAGLIQAISQKRLPEVERQRAALLLSAKAAGQLRDVRALNEVLYRPLIEHANARGERWFGRFVLALFCASDGLRLARGGQSLSPVAEHVLDLQSAANPSVPSALLRERHRLVAIMILMAVFNPRDPDARELDEAIVDNALDMATSALTAPVSKSVRAMLRKTAPRRSTK